MATPDRIVHVTKLAVIESLTEVDEKTGEKLAQDVREELRAANVAPQVDVYKCSGTEAFHQAMATLVGEAERREHHPIIHIECHGDDVEGLTFADGTTISWLELTDALRPLNKATEGGLIVTVAACCGIGAIRGLDLTNEAPFYALIGPSELIWGSELSTALKTFYLDLILRVSAEEAGQKLVNTRLERGQFVVVTGRLLFREIMLRYVRTRTSPRERKEQALRQHLRARSEGIDLGMRYWKRHYLQTLPTLLRQYHERFFMVHEFPQHAQHFAHAMAEVERELHRQGLVKK